MAARRAHVARSHHSLFGGLIATLLVLGAGPTGIYAEAAERVTIEIVNHVTEALLTSVTSTHCLNGVTVLDARTILIERPRLTARLTIDREGECASSTPALEIELYHLGGGEIGGLELGWSINGEIQPNARADAGRNACVKVAAQHPNEGPRLSFVFAPCE